MLTAGYGQSAEVRKLFDTPQMHANLRNELIIGQVNERLCAIGRGQDLDQAVDSYIQRMRDDVTLTQKRQERLQGYLESSDPSDSEQSSGAESSEETLEQDLQALPTNEADVISTGAAEEGAARASVIDKNDGDQ